MAVRHNPSIERTSQGLRPCAAAHVKPSGKLGVCASYMAEAAGGNERVLLVSDSLMA